jgi:inositol-hexakisphosphate 5-kinase
VEYQQYLSNGSGLHHDSLRSLYNQLQKLERVVRETTGVRFWGASLLLIYEGDRRQAERREDVHLIDFAHCQMSDALDSPDDGLLLGLSNLIAFLANIIARDHET